VRPEALRVANGIDAGDCCFDTAVDVVEPLGNEILLNFRAGGVAMVARVAPSVRVKPHERLRFALDPEQLYFFDGESEAAI
jgi:multiple sugar transport system ATP-binding protein